VIILNLFELIFGSLLTLMADLAYFYRILLPEKSFLDLSQSSHCFAHFYLFFIADSTCFKQRKKYFYSKLAVEHIRYTPPAIGWW
jgi:hypothetical protein